MWRPLLLAVALVSPIAAQAPPDAFQVGTASGLFTGDVYVYLTTATNNICVNTYVIDPNQNLQACCSSILLPNQTAMYSVHRSFMTNTFDGTLADSYTIALVATVPLNPPGPYGYGHCDASVSSATPSAGLAASFAVPVVYDNGEPSVAPFQSGGPAWSSLSARCAYIMATGEGYGLCAATMVAMPPASIAVVSGSGQSATVNGLFAKPLVAIVRDSYGNPLSGIVVTFTAPSAGASASFGGALTTTAVTGANGLATSPVLTANATPGGYAVAASVPGIAPASFSLTNTAARTIGSSVATPTTIPVGVPTPITVTSLITDSSLITGSVNLQLLNSSGVGTTILGILHDDGLNGDAVAGDHIYTLQVTLNEPQAGPISLRVSAAFPRILTRVFSPVMTVSVGGGS